MNYRPRLHKIWDLLTRKKPLAQSYLEVSDLSRVLGLLDLTALGVAATLGMGVYIMVGSIARIAGPGAILSFFIAGVAAALSGLCYGEFAARVPKAGSAYVYSYVSIGEFVAFIVGWNLVLEYVIGTACVARGLSNYVDTIIDDKISEFLSKSMSINIPYLSSYPDFFAFFIMICFSCILAFGVVLSSNFNKMFTTINLTTILIVILTGIYKANFKNWFLSPSAIPAGAHGGKGGFFPFGIAGVFSGAAKCFYAYTGFDCVATTGEEAKKPQRYVPLALILTLLVAFIAYLGICMSVTLMWPYYDQSIRAPFPYVFDKVDLPQIKWLVTIGALSALCACMVSSTYGTSRIIYSMANDGLLFECLSYVSQKTQTPISATFMVGIFTGTVATFFDMEMLVDMTSIGTLMAYTIVSICVLLLRYDTTHDDYPQPEIELKNGSMDVNKTKEQSAFNEINSTGNNGDTFKIETFNFIKVFKLVFNLDYLSSSKRKQMAPTRYTSIVVKIMTLVNILASILLSSILTITDGGIYGINWFQMMLLFVSVLSIGLSTISISRQPESNEKLTFKVRCVPFIPVVSSFMNILLMMMLNLHTWIRFIVWMIIGFVIYFGYGVKHSKESKFYKNKVRNKRITKTQCQQPAPISSFDNTETNSEHHSIP